MFLRSSLLREIVNIATKNWFGGVGGYSQPDNWQPAGVPQAGDVAFVATGNVNLSTTIVSGVTIGLEGTSAATEPTLALRNVLFSSDLHVGVPPQPTGFFYGRVTVEGLAITTGTLLDGSGRGGTVGRLEVDIARGSVLLNTGSIDVERGSQLTISADHQAGLFIQDGIYSADGFSVIDAAVIGSGSFSVGFDPDSESSLEFGGAVSRGITVDFSPAPGNLILDKPLQFLGAVENFGEDTIDLPKTVVTSGAFKDDELSLFNGTNLVAKLNIIGDFNTASFAVFSDGNGGTAFQLAALRGGSGSLSALDSATNQTAVPAHLSS